MKELKGTKTEQNLKTAFAGESEATNKYTYFASKAKKDGYVQIASIFEETAANEREHANLVQAAERRRSGLHSGESGGSSQRRELRVDGYVREVCQGGKRRRL